MKNNLVPQDFLDLVSLRNAIIELLDVELPAFDLTFLGRLVATDFFQEFGCEPDTLTEKYTDRTFKSNHYPRFWIISYLKRLVRKEPDFFYTSKKLNT